MTKQFLLKNDPRILKSVTYLEYSILPRLSSLRELKHLHAQIWK
jgi:hypothetical protein